MGGKERGGGRRHARKKRQPDCISGRKKKAKQKPGTSVVKEKGLLRLKKKFERKGKKGGTGGPLPSFQAGEKKQERQSLLNAKGKKKESGGKGAGALPGLGLRGEKNKLLIDLQAMKGRRSGGLLRERKKNKKNRKERRQAPLPLSWGGRERGGENVSAATFPSLQKRSSHLHSFWGGKQSKMEKEN